MVHNCEVVGLKAALMILIIWLYSLNKRRKKGFIQININDLYAETNFVVQKSRIKVVISLCVYLMDYPLHNSYCMLGKGQTRYPKIKHRPLAVKAFRQAIKSSMSLTIWTNTFNIANRLQIPELWSYIWRGHSQTKPGERFVFNLCQS